MWIIINSSLFHTWLWQHADEFKYPSGKNIHVHWPPFYKNAYCAWWDSGGKKKKRCLPSLLWRIHQVALLHFSVQSFSCEYRWSNGGTTLIHPHSLLLSPQCALSSGTSELRVLGIGTQLSFFFFKFIFLFFKFNF